jgi:nucleoid DNA-binding protein
MDQTLLNLYKAVAKETGVSERKVEYIIKNTFHDIRREIASPSGKDILLHSFINFQIPFGRIEKAKEVATLAYEKGKISKSVLRKAIKRLETKDGK